MQPSPEAPPAIDAPPYAPPITRAPSFPNARATVYYRAREPRRSRRRFAGGVTQILVLASLLYVCVFNLSIVRGSSMAPCIHDGDRILVDHFSYWFHSVERGDIVVLKYPLDPSVDYIKRVIGLPGDEIDIEGGRVSVNGAPLDEPYVAANDYLTRVHIEVRPAHYFVLGDNRPRSCDSREFGLVPAGYVRGKVELRVWPPSRVGVIDDTE